MLDRSSGDRHFVAFEANCVGEIAIDVDSLNVCTACLSRASAPAIEHVPHANCSPNKPWSISLPQAAIEAAWGVYVQESDFIGGLIPKCVTDPWRNQHERSRSCAHGLARRLHIEVSVEDVEGVVLVVVNVRRWTFGVGGQRDNRQMYSRGVISPCKEFRVSEEIAAQAARRAAY